VRDRRLAERRVQRGGLVRVLAVAQRARALERDAWHERRVVRAAARGGRARRDRAS
jgi:hypothetical protein